MLILEDCPAANSPTPQIYLAAEPNEPSREVAAV